MSLREGKVRRPDLFFRKNFGHSDLMQPMRVTKHLLVVSLQFKAVVVFCFFMNLRVFVIVSWDISHKTACWTSP